MPRPGYAGFDSLSGKWEKTRRYGKPIRDEAWLETTLESFAPIAFE